MNDESELVAILRDAAASQHGHSPLVPIPHFHAERAANALVRLAAENERLAPVAADRHRAQSDYAETMRKYDQAVDEIFQLRAKNAAQAERIERLEEALRPLADACYQEMHGEVCNDEPDDEPVSTGVDRDGRMKPSPITFGMIRRARVALEPRP